MSKNPAWSNYNRTTEKIEADYKTATNKPRLALEASLTDIERKFAPKIEALEVERDTHKSATRKIFQDKVEAAAKERTKALKIALEVRNAELKALAEEKKAEAAAPA